MRRLSLGREGVLEGGDPRFEGEKREDLVFPEVWGQLDRYIGLIVG